MKNWQITGFIAILILGFLLISGCTTTPKSLTDDERLEIATQSLPVIKNLNTPDSLIVLHGKPIIARWNPQTNKLYANESYDSTFNVPHIFIPKNNDKKFTVLFMETEKYEKVVGTWTSKGVVYPGVVVTTKIYAVYWPEKQMAGIAHVKGSEPGIIELGLWDISLDGSMVKAVVGQDNIDKWLFGLSRNFATSSTSASSTSIILSGNGDDLKSFTVNRTELSKFSLSHPGQDHFEVDLRDSNGNFVTSFAYDSYLNNKSEKLKAGTYYLDIEASSPWTIDISSM